MEPPNDNVLETGRTGGRGQVYLVRRNRDSWLGGAKVTVRRKIVAVNWKMNPMHDPLTDARSVSAGLLRNLKFLPPYRCAQRK